MAGGRGERFWPLGRRQRPKQLLPLSGESTMIEETVQRLFPLIAPERLLVITNAAFVEPIRRLLPIPAENVIGEPVGRDTAPCAALATALVKRRDPEATMILLPADHLIHPVREFQEVLSAAAEQAAAGALVTLGVKPTYPATGYGYIHVGEELAPGFHRARGFREKPGREMAEAFLLDGSYLWNSGMFIWRADAIEKAFRLHCPELADRIGQWIQNPEFEESFVSCPKISIDYAVMEKAGNVVVGKAAFEWNDIGSWSALRAILPTDENGNAIRGNVAVLEAKNNVLIGDRDHMLGVIGIENLAVIQSGNGTIVCPLSEEQRIKELVQLFSSDYQ